MKKHFISCNTKLSRHYGGCANLSQNADGFGGSESARVKGWRGEWVEVGEGIGREGIEGGYEVEEMHYAICLRFK